MNEIVGALGPQYIDAASITATISDSLLVPERLSAVSKTFKDEVRDSSFGEKATASMVLGAFALEQGPINETISAIITTSTLSATGNPITAGVIGGLSYAAQQAIYGLATAKGVTAIPKTEAAYHEQFTIDDEEKKAVSRLEKAGVLMFLGMSALVLNEHAQVSDQDFKKDVKLVRNWMPALIAVDLAVFSGASYGIENSDVVGIEPGAVIDALTNPVTFIAVFGLWKFRQHYNRYQENIGKPTLTKKLKNRIKKTKATK